MSQGTDHVLSDLRVLDFSRALAGPSCTRMLAEMGADVIKVEASPNGELARRFSNYKNNRSLYYVQQNLGKKSLCVNIRDPRALAMIAELIPQMDVVVENFKPGVIADMGFGYERLREMKKDIVLCSISALGQKGPLSSKPGYDYIAQAYSGVTSMIGEPDDAPYIPLVGMGDVSTGVHAALAIVSALRYRDRTGEGQHLDIALLDVYYHYHEANVHAYSGSDGAVKPTRAGRHMTYACPGGVFRGKGGYLVIMSFLHHWKDLCEAMGRQDLVTDPNFSTDLARLARRAEVVKLIEDWLQTFPDVPSAIAHMEKHQVPVAPVLSVVETTQHPHHRARGTVRTVHDRLAGDFDIPGMPLKFSRFPKDLPLEAATLGQHNEEILTRYLGRSSQEVQQLRDAGVLVEKEI
ncbi:MAG: CoA transferase [Deltaproteobacteria bacterium]|nr:CoA transferase [Deltaproteobacteria bacterium]